MTRSDPKGSKYHPCPYIKPNVRMQYPLYGPLLAFRVCFSQTPPSAPASAVRGAPPSGASSVAPTPALSFHPRARFSVAQG